MYIHYHTHCLNFVLVDSTKSVEAAEFFAILELLYIFMSTSKVHIIYIQQQSYLHPAKLVRQLQRLSGTRWACRFNAVDAVCSTFDSILATLQSIMDGNDKVKVTKVSGFFTDSLL